MQIIINSTDTIETLIVARNTINDILARRDHKPTPDVLTPTGLAALTVQQIASQHPELVQQPPAPPAPAPKPTKAKPKVVKTVSAEEVRMVMVAKSAEGKRDDVIAILAGFGAKKLSEVAPEMLVDLKEKLEAL